MLLYVFGLRSEARVGVHLHEAVQRHGFVNVAVDCV
jgi:hypothetical protein